MQPRVWREGWVLILTIKSLVLVSLSSDYILVNLKFHSFRSWQQILFDTAFFVQFQFQFTECPPKMICYDTSFISLRSEDIITSCSK